MRNLLLAFAALPTLAAAAAPAPITADELVATVKTLESDPFQGRAPGGPGEQKTLDYVIGRLKALGLQPAGPNGQWTQAVPLVHDVSGTPTKLEVSVAGSTITLTPGQDIAPATMRQTSQVAFDNAPMVFVGYGVSAPERGWDDYKGVDLHGKVAVYLVNDPDYEAKPGDPVADKFGGQAETYYGRWLYKYEEAARKGAIGALIVHETGPAGYGWNVAGNTAGGTYALPVEPGQPQPPALQAWISNAFARSLFTKAGLDLDTLKVKARSPDFRPVPMGDAKFSVAMPVTTSVVESHNILAKIPGTTHADETVMFGAHWDAFGIGKPDAQGRTIRPGANDDGLGVASLLALARVYKAMPAPQRTIAFGIWTAEERGLLGSEYYARHPAFPMAKVVGNMTIDILQTAGPARDVVLVGAGQDSLETDLAKAAAEQGRTVTPDAKPERGLVYRADHFSFAKRGVPTLLLMGAGGGVDLVNGGRAGGDAWVADYTDHCYHQTCDVWSPAWDLRGAIQDVQLFQTIGQRLANSRAWPTWNTGSEFKAIRDKTAAERKP